MRYKFILDNIFGQKSKIKVLRYLASGRPDASVREIAAQTRLSPPNASIALRELEKEGALKSLRIGRSIVYSLNDGHYLVEKIIKPVFGNESGVKSALANLIKNKINFPYESIIIFGSVARGSAKPASDIDLAVIIKDGEDKIIIEDKIAAFNPLIAKIFGNSLSPIVYKKSEFLKKIKKKDALAGEIVREGEVAAGKLISELL